MSDYKESTIAGTTWQRCHQIVIENPREGAATVRFEEEEVLALDGREVRRSVGAITVPVDMVKTFAMLDPVTGQPTGEQVSYGYARAMLASAYLAAAAERDAALAPPPEPAI